MRIVLAVPRYPWPPRRGDQLRTLQAARALGRRHRVTLLVPEPPAGAPRPPKDLPGRVVLYAAPGLAERAAGTAAAALRGLPLQSGLFASAGLSRVLAERLPSADLVVAQLVRLAPHLPHPLHPEGTAAVGVPLVVDLIDSLALSTRRRVGFDRPWLAPALRLEARRLERWEGRLAERAAATLLVSERDRAAVAASRPAAAERVRVVPVAVPAAEPSPRTGTAPEPDGPPVLAVTGNLGYFPTAEGLDWLLREVWPGLRARRPELRLVLAGSRPGRDLLRRARRAGAEVLVDPPSLGPVLRRAAVALAPMRCGAGQPLKVLEAWGAGVPVVTTPWTAAGTTCRPGEDLLVAEGADGWTAAVLGLLEDPERRRRIAASARARLEADYGEERVARSWLEAAASAARSRK